MVDKTKQVKIRESWQVIFNVLKNIAPESFGTKVFTDIDVMGNDDEDSSYMMIKFKKESD